MGKRGPKPNPDEKAVLSTRISAKTRAAVEKAAKASGRTLSREIESRLNRTINEDQSSIDQFGSVRNRRLMQMLALAMRNVYNPASPDADWMDDPWSYAQVCITIEKLLDLMRPPGGADAIPDAVLNNIPGEIVDAKARAATLLFGIRNADASVPIAPPQRHFANQIKSDLGEVLDRAGPIFHGTADDMRRGADLLRALDSGDVAAAEQVIEAQHAIWKKRRMRETETEWWDHAVVRLNELKLKGTQ